MLALNRLLGSSLDTFHQGSGLLELHPEALPMIDYCQLIVAPHARLPTYL